ncbi:MAG: hypothetical protein ACXAEF_04085 [Candidatus Thorarchaeota archaeon]|jgi:hypothetical protein
MEIMDEEFTDDMMRLLLVIDSYTREGHEENPIWVKELPLMAIIYQGIVKGIFRDYDYAPWSVPMLDGTREWLNISREGKDDLEDLLNLRMISILRVSTSQYGFVTAYRLTELGQDQIKTATEPIQQEVTGLIHHSCGGLFSVAMNGSDISFRCDPCNFNEEIPIGEIEDIPYTTSAYLPSFNFGWFGVDKENYFERQKEEES